MSVVRILVSGVLVAGGLVLGTFAAAGYLDPQWTQNQLAASAGGEPAVEQKTLSTFHRTRFVTEAAAERRPPNSAIVKASANVVAKAHDVRPPTAKPASKRSSRKKTPERGKAEPPKAQQAAAQFQWPSWLFGN